MRVGVLADTHDRLPAVAEFARRFREAGIGMVLHAGDYCASWSLRPIIAANLALAGVYGRNDGDHEGLQAEAAKGVGVEIYESPHSVELGGARLLLVHDIGDVNARSVAGHVIVIHGFTHERRLENTGDTLILNPGEACGWLGGTPSAAILDLETKQVEFLSIDP
ncbi:MAG TPA: YfcE family phosphodiesterase [Gemmatimonadaceae bacterium]|jgi:putative phosphoesterase|nr:YfcE family phosphodiesterase [Gemmatimonadaceae bacterium]